MSFQSRFVWKIVTALRAYKVAIFFNLLLEVVQSGLPLLRLHVGPHVLVVVPLVRQQLGAVGARFGIVSLPTYMFPGRIEIFPHLLVSSLNVYGQFVDMFTTVRAFVLLCAFLSCDPFVVFLGRSRSIFHLF